LKRSLRVIGDSGDAPVKAPLRVAIGARLVSVVDADDGLAALRFVDVLVDAGAARVDAAADANPDIRIVIRGAPRSAEAQLRAEVLEEDADVVLGSARAAFARHFASACAGWVNS
jgi:hypothetical protein